LLGFYEALILSIGFRKKYSNIKFHENPSSGSRGPWAGEPASERTDGHEEAAGRISEFCESAYNQLINVE